MKLSLDQRCILSVLHGQYLACWCSGDFRSLASTRRPAIILSSDGLSVHCKCDIYICPMQWIFDQHCWYWWTGALWHQGISSHSTKYAPMCFQLFKSWYKRKIDVSPYQRGVTVSKLLLHKFLNATMWFEIVKKLRNSKNKQTNKQKHMKKTTHNPPELGWIVCAVLIPAQV